MFVIKSFLRGHKAVTLSADSPLAAIAEAEALLPADTDAWARLDDKWLAAGWPGLVVPAAWNVTLAPHGTHQLWVEQV